VASLRESNGHSSITRDNPDHQISRPQGKKLTKWNRRHPKRPHGTNPHGRIRQQPTL